MVAAPSYALPNLGYISWREFLGMFKHPIAAAASAVSILFFFLTQIANVFAIAHLPADLREALIAMSHIPTLLAWAILAIGILIAAYLAIQHFKKPKEGSTPDSAITERLHQQFALALDVPQNMGADTPT